MIASASSWARSIWLCTELGAGADLETDKALSLLGLAHGADQGDIERAYADRMHDLRARIADAPSPGLRAKFVRQAAELDEAVAHIRAPSQDPFLTDLPTMRGAAKAPVQVDSADDDCGAGDRIPDPAVGAQPKRPASLVSSAVRGIGLGRPWLGLEPAQMMTICAGIGAVLVALLTYPIWKDSSPWQLSAEKAELARLAGVVRALASRADQQTSALKQGASEDKRAEDDLSDKLESGQAGARSRSANRRYVVSALKSAASNDLWTRYDAQTSARLPNAQVALAEAEGLMSGGDSQRALAEFRRLDREYLDITQLPARLSLERAAQTSRLEAKIAGSWSSGACTAAGQIRIADGSLAGVWPGQGPFKEEIMGADDGTLFTVVSRPERNAGAVYSYALDGPNLEMREFPDKSVKLRLTRC